MILLSKRPATTETPTVDAVADSIRQRADTSTETTSNVHFAVEDRNKNNYLKVTFRAFVLSLVDVAQESFSNHVTTRR